MTDGLRFLFGFRGRMTRAQFAIRAAIWAAYLAILNVAVFQFMDDIWRSDRAALSAALLLPFVLGMLSAMVRRLHDRNRQGIWAAVYVGLPALFFVWAVMTALLHLFDSAYNSRFEFLMLLTAVTLGVGFLDLALMMGTKGANRYGPG